MEHGKGAVLDRCRRPGIPGLSMCFDKHGSSVAQMYVPCKGRKPDPKLKDSTTVCAAHVVGRLSKRPDERVFVNRSGVQRANARRLPDDNRATGRWSWRSAGRPMETLPSTRSCRCCGNGVAIAEPSLERRIGARGGSSVPMKPCLVLLSFCALTFGLQKMRSKVDGESRECRKLGAIVFRGTSRRV